MPLLSYHIISTNLVYYNILLYISVLHLYQFLFLKCQTSTNHSLRTCLFFVQYTRYSAAMPWYTAIGVTPVDGGITVT